MFVIGILIGFFVSFFVLKRSINNAGCGELKMCRNRCPYYGAVEKQQPQGEADD